MPTSLDLSSDQGFDFGSDNVPGTSSAFSAVQLRNFMEVDIDNSGLAARVDLTGLSGQGKVTGVQIADFIQDQLNSKFGDERYFDIQYSIQPHLLRVSEERTRPISISD